MSKETLLLGRSGEQLAADFIKAAGYKILFKNYRSKLGEIDLIALCKDTICFIEVKTRASDRFGFPSEAVLGAKQKKLCRTALMFLKEKKLLDKKARFDVVSVAYARGSAPKIDLIQNAFELDGMYSY